MTRVSKRPLGEDVRGRIDSRLVEAVTNLRTKAEGAHFISELLSDAEQLILAKRLMIIFMLNKGVSQYRIVQLLNVSSATVFRVDQGMVEGKYEYLGSVCRKKKNRQVFLKELEVIVRFGMPSMGRDRWKWLDELYEK